MTNTAGTLADLAIAREALRRQGNGFVVVQSGRIVAGAADHGLVSLIEVAERLRASRIEGAALADTVMGCAAVLVAVWAGIGAIHAETISDAAVEESSRWGIAPSFGARVPRILNRSHDGPCPFETAAHEEAARGATPDAIVETLRAVARALARRPAARRGRR